MSAAAALLSVVLSSPTVSVTIGPADTPLPVEAAMFFMDRPDLTAWFLKRKRLAPYVIERTGPRKWHGDDGGGTRGDFELVRSAEGERLWFGEGTHHTSRKLVPDLDAYGAISMRASPVRQDGCPPAVATKFKVSILVKNGFLAKLAWIVQSYITDTVKRRFERAVEAARKVALMLAQDPKGVSSELAAYPGLDQPGRAELARLVRRMRPLPRECRAGVNPS